jgi:23S rRNA (cytidine1920-2'-O)/16S rRNA (cytidine1409-2'-O)-methyltransferase
MAAAGDHKQRLDLAVVERGLADTRSRARALILAGDILVNGSAAHHAGTMVRRDDELQLKSRPRFVSRGGEKLEHALESFGIDVSGAVCVDLGASTGGFTDCLLQRGAAKVYAVDVGYSQLDASLRDDHRVTVMERTNARYLEELPELVDLVVIDVSFISLSLILPVAARLLRQGGVCIPLIKPQFEAGRKEVGKGGVVRNPDVHRRVLSDVIGFAERDGFEIRGLVRSPLLGPSGNVEFLVHLKCGSEAPQGLIDLNALIDDVVPK